MSEFAYFCRASHVCLFFLNLLGQCFLILGSSKSWNKVPYEFSNFIKFLTQAWNWRSILSFFSFCSACLSDRIIFPDNILGKIFVERIRQFFI